MKMNGFSQNLVQTIRTTASSALCTVLPLAFMAFYTNPAMAAIPIERDFICLNSRRSNTAAGKLVIAPVDRGFTFTSANISMRFSPEFRAQPASITYRPILSPRLTAELSSTSQQDSVGAIVKVTAEKVVVGPRGPRSIIGDGGFSKSVFCLPGRNDVPVADTSDLQLKQIPLLEPSNGRGTTL